MRAMLLIRQIWTQKKIQKTLLFNDIFRTPNSPYESYVMNYMPLNIQFLWLTLKDPDNFSMEIQHFPIL